MQTRKMRYLALALAVLLAALCIAPALAHAAHRNCPGPERCLICRAIENGALVLRLLLAFAAALLALALLRLRVCAEACVFAPCLRAYTPVSRKVRLNN